jgi:hypothetical protein
MLRHLALRMAAARGREEAENCQPDEEQPANHDGR